MLVWVAASRRSAAQAWGWSSRRNTRDAQRMRGWQAGGSLKRSLGMASDELPRSTHDEQAFLLSKRGFRA